MTWTPPLHEPERELREQLGESEWRAAILAICERHDLPREALAPFPTGSDVVWAAGDHVVKLTAPCWRGQIEDEARWLERVDGRLSVRTPALLARGELSGWPYLVMSRVPGVALGSVWPRAGHAERTGFARELGRLVRELHGLALDGESDGWGTFWSGCRTDVARRHAEPDVPDGLAAAVGPFLDSVGPLACEPRVFLHTELLDQHVLVEQRGARHELCGLIDFADARFGPAEYDFPAPVEFLFAGEPGLLRAFLLAYGYTPDALTPATSERLLAWGLSHRYGRLARMLRAVAPAGPRTLEELARKLYGVSCQSLGAPVLESGQRGPFGP